MKIHLSKPHIKIIKIISVFLVISIISLYISRLIPSNKQGVNLGESGIGEKAIAITFDDGPGKYTEKLLDGLSEYNVKASFFVLGKKAENNPHIIKRIYDEGHLLGMHTNDHTDFYHESVISVNENVPKNSNILENITGEKPVFLRAPYGNVTPVQLKKIDNIFVSWSLDSFDWRGKNEDYIYNRLINKAADGDIILMHDTKETTVNAVLRAIPQLQKMGFEIVRVDDLLARNGKELNYGVAYRSSRHNKIRTVF